MSAEKKNMNDVYVNVDRTCQDHTFAARIEVVKPSDSQRHENGKCLLVKKHKQLLCKF